MEEASMSTLCTDEIYDDVDEKSKKEIMIELIHKYRDLPVLWNNSLKEYSNRDKKRDAYIELCKVYQKINKNGTVEDLKKKLIL